MDQIPLGAGARGRFLDWKRGTQILFTEGDASGPPGTGMAERAGVEPTVVVERNFRSRWETSRPRPRAL